MDNIPIIFDRDKVKKFRNRAAKNISDHDFLINEVSNRILQSLDAIRGGYENVLYIGYPCKIITEHFEKQKDTKLFVIQDIALNMAAKYGGIKVVADEEKIPYADKSFDLVIANLVMHNVNDLPGTLVQLRRVLKNDGVFFATIFGVDTLKELRNVFLELESEITGGGSPRIFPFTDVKTMGSLMHRAGFLEPVADFDNIRVEYDNAFELMCDIRGMGESNSLIKSGKTLNKRVLQYLNERYGEKFPDSGQGIVATFNIINITGLAAFGV
ncbi:MAG: SAM-dependent methyltransferase [Alphaproteobacteria bacterium CG11_big_fil_rev_8_21_14_0_20_39_49]|nr:MAG: SAM-dependent methyltransferase [Alphaproteobacteria bacterium CG11_big_fil_rev_8_21_14_0_20_39_49]